MRCTYKDELLNAGVFMSDIYNLMLMLEFWEHMNAETGSEEEEGNESEDESNLNAEPEIDQPPQPQQTHTISTMKKEEIKALESTYEGEIENSDEVVTEEGISKLVDLAAEVVGRKCEPHDIVRCDPPLDEPLYQKVLKNVVPKTMTDMIFLKTMHNIETKDKNIHREALELLKQKKITSIIQIGFVLLARFHQENKESTSKANADVIVTIEFAKRRITAVRCDKCVNNTGCVHAYAAMVYQIYLPCLVKTYPPVTDTLSTMSRDDLQTLLQLILSEESSLLMMKCQKHIDVMLAEKYKHIEGRLLHDRSVSSTSTRAAMYKSAIQERLKQLRNTASLKYFEVFYYGNRSLVKRHLKEAVQMCRRFPKQGYMLSLDYICSIGIIARTVHKKIVRGETFFKSREDCVVKSFNFLTDFMASAACVYTQRHHRITIDSINVDKWKQRIEVWRSTFRQQYSRFIVPSSGQIVQTRSPRSFKQVSQVSMPRIYPLYQRQIEEVFGYKRGGIDDIEFNFLSEIIASLFVPPPPEEYIELVTDEDVEPENSTYDEPLQIMMLRANTYDYTELSDQMTEEVNTEMLRLVDKLIMTLGKIALKYSILSISCKTPDFEDPSIRADSSDADEQLERAFTNFVLDTFKDQSSGPVDKENIQTDENGNIVTIKKENERLKNCRYSLRKRKTSNAPMNKFEPCSSSTSSKRRKKCVLTVNNHLADNTGARNRESNSASTSHIGDSDKNCEAYAPKTLLDGPVDENMSREQLCYCLLYWLHERDDIIRSYENVARYMYYPDSSTTECIIHGIQWLALELSRFRLTKDKYTAEEQECLSNLEYNNFMGLECFGTRYQHTFWLFLYAWDNLGFGHYGDHFPTVLGSCIFSWQMEGELNPERCDVILYKRVLGKFLIHETKVKYHLAKSEMCFEDRLSYTQPMLPQMWAYTNLLRQYLHYEDQVESTCLICHKVVEACLHSGDVTKVRALYDMLSYLFSKNQSRFDDNDYRGLKLKLRIALQLSNVYHDSCERLSGEIKSMCEHLGDNCLPILEDCTKDPQWAFEVVKQRYNIKFNYSTV